ncbi:TadE/TadG family type IV pilus assembly protein [Rhodobacter sp. NSM]|uniref:TadE/TadG family type IV pilus assembly protein n=1 Tax=Rhodobacter sp. NSM TaxID=3457501 RepID=UPI003FD69559
MFRPTLIAKRASAIRHFASNESGTMLSEFVIVLPILLWAWLGMYTFWQTYATMNRVQKAAFVVSDALSRSTGEVNEDELDGMFDLMDYLIGGRGDPVARYTSVGWNPTTSAYYVMWSYSSDNVALPPLNTGTISKIESHLPTLVNLETVIVVEASYDYQPVFSPFTLSGVTIGLDEITFDETVVTRPRFVIKVCKEYVDCGAVS